MVSMPPVKANWFFARLNLLPVPPADQKLDILKSGLQAPSREHRGFLWRFLDVDTLTVSGQDFLTAYLVKYRPEAAEKVVDEKAGTFSETKVSYPVEAQSRFFLHIKSLLLAYRPAGGKIRPDTFCSRFADLFEYQEPFHAVEINPIHEEHVIWDEIKKFDRVDRFKVRLHPSNPKTKDLWDFFDERLKELGAASYEEEIKADEKSERGLRLADDKETKAKIGMAEDGYGRATVTGHAQGKTKTVSTARSPIKAKAPIDKPPEATLERLYETFKRFFGRT